MNAVAAVWVIAGILGGLTAKTTIVFTQALPAALALVFVALAARGREPAAGRGAPAPAHGLRRRRPVRTLAAGWDLTVALVRRNPWLDSPAGFAVTAAGCVVLTLLAVVMASVSL